MQLLKRHRLIEVCGLAFAICEVPAESAFGILTLTFKYHSVAAAVQMSHGFVLRMFQLTSVLRSSSVSPGVKPWRA